jgi:predicted RNase H-like HicB family nuclease
MHFSIDSHQEPDGRWAAQVPEFPGVIAFAATQQEAIAKAELRALIALAERRFQMLRAG